MRPIHYKRETEDEEEGLWGFVGNRCMFIGYAQHSFGDNEYPETSARRVLKGADAYYAAAA